MNRFRVLTTVLALFAFAPVAAAQDLVLLVMADTHSAYDRYPRLLSLVRDTVAGYEAAEEGGSEVAIVFDGDLFELGNAAALASGGVADWAFLEALDEIAPVIVNVGNHEFDFVGPQAFVAEAEARGIEVIGNLVDAAGGDPLTPMVATLEVAGRTVDLVGIATNAVNTYAAPARELLRFPDPVAFAAYLGPLTVLADHVVILSHAGVAADREILAAAPEETLFVVGAHDHLVLRDASLGAPYLHTGFKGERIAVAEVTFTAGGGAEVAFRELLTDEHEGTDAALAAEIERVRAEFLTPEDRAVVGTVPRDYGVREAAQWAVDTLADATSADVALLNHTSFGAGLEAGELQRYEYDAFLRFDNDVMVTTLDGATLAGVLARADQGPDTALAERSGDFVYASAPLPEIDPAAEYRVVTSSWVALPFNQPGYLGLDGVAFEQIEGVTTKGILLDALE